MQVTEARREAVEEVLRRGCFRDGGGWRRMLRFLRLLDIFATGERAFGKEEGIGGEKIDRGGKRKARKEASDSKREGRCRNWHGENTIALKPVRGQ